MDNEFGKNTVVLTDENGQEVELEHLDTVEYKNATYMAFTPACGSRIDWRTAKILP